MTTLTNIAQTTKKVLILTIFIVVGSIFLYIIISSLKNILRNYRPTPPLAVYTVFNKIPKVTFPQQTFPDDIKFSVETLSGKIPEASSTAKIFFLAKKQQGLLTNVRVTQDAKKLGFVGVAQVVDKKLIFRESGKELVIDPVNRNFTYQYDYINDGSVFLGKTKLDKNSAKTLALNFLNNLSAIPQDYDSQNPQVTFLTFNGAQFIPTGGGMDDENATSIRIDYFRNRIDNLPVVTPKYNEGNLSVIVSKALDIDKQIIKAQRYYQEISPENIGIYPLRNSNLAWQDFLGGEGYIANSGNSTFTKKVVIRDAFLAYYDNWENQSYLMPVYVFIGDEGFIGFVNAVDKEWLIE